MTPCPDVSLLWGSFTLHCSQIICVLCFIILMMSHMQKSQFIIIMVLFSLAVLSGFSNHMYLQNRHKCIEPLQEPWLNPASDLICKTFQNFWKLIEWKQKSCQQMYGNVMNWTCQICWTVFIDAKFISLSHSLSHACFSFALSFSLTHGKTVLLHVLLPGQLCGFVYYLITLFCLALY